MKNQKKFKELLENVSDSYSDFVIGNLREAKDDDRFEEMLTDYIESHPKALTSDIIRYATEEILNIKPIN